MPTAARLMAAICLAVAAFVLSQMVINMMPDNTYFGSFTAINMGLGALAGWIVMGPRAGRGYANAITNGITGIVVLLLWGLAYQSIAEMLRLSLRRRFDGLFEALIGALNIGAEYALIITTVPMGIALLVLGVGGGIVTEYAARKWR